MDGAYWTPNSIDGLLDEDDTEDFLKIIKGLPSNEKINEHIRAEILAGIKHYVKEGYCHLGVQPGTVETKIEIPLMDRAEREKETETLSANMSFCMSDISVENDGKDCVVEWIEWFKEAAKYLEEEIKENS